MGWELKNDLLSTPHGELILSEDEDINEWSPMTDIQDTELVLLELNCLGYHPILRTITKKSGLYLTHRAKLGEWLLLIHKDVGEMRVTWKDHDFDMKKAICKAVLSMIESGELDAS